MTDRIESIEELEALYGSSAGVPPGAIDKVTDRLTPLQRRYIDASPFALVATVAGEGVDCSPRGDPAGFVRIVDDRTLQMPDRRGNNRLDSLRNIVRDGRIALLFLVPGVGITLRVNGTAVLRTAADLCESFAMGDKLPRSVIEVAISEVYTQCPKALIRSHIWDPDQFRAAADLPTVGQIMEEITSGAFDGTTYDTNYPDRIQATIY